MQSVGTVWSLSSSEWAAWVQAIVSGLAIVAAALIAGKQAKSQYEGTRRLQREDHLQAQKRFTAAISMLARNASQLANHILTSLGTREQVHEVATGRQHLDLGELVTVAGAISSIPLHDLPSSELVRLTMMLSSTIRQFSEKVNFALTQHRAMDGGNFTDFFNSMQEMTESLRETCDGFRAELVRLEREA